MLLGGFNVEFDSHQESTGLTVIELGRIDDIAPVVGEAASDGGNKAGPVVALKGEGASFSHRSLFFAWLVVGFIVANPVDGLFKAPERIEMQAHQSMLGAKTIGKLSDNLVRPGSPNQFGNRNSILRQD